MDIVLHDGKTMKSDGTLSLDGTPGALSGTYGADKANLKLPAPNTLVMQLVDHGTPASTRIYTVAADRTTMTEPRRSTATTARRSCRPICSSGCLSVATGTTPVERAW